MSFKWKYLITILLVVIQPSFFKGLGYPWFNMNLLISMAVFWIVYDGLEGSLGPIMVGAILLDLFSGNIFGVIIMAVFLSCHLINLIFLHIFTNSSLFSLLVLGVVMSVLYNFLLSFFKYFVYWINISSHSMIFDKAHWVNLGWSVVFVAAFLVVFGLVKVRRVNEATR